MLMIKATRSDESSIPMYFKDLKSCAKYFKVPKSRVLSTVLSGKKCIIYGHHLENSEVEESYA